jgi:hypothetical protein
MAKKLTRLKIDEISLVDRGAGEGVRVMLAKRRDRMSVNEKRYAAAFANVDWTKAMISQPSRVPDEDVDNGDNMGDDDGKISPKLRQMVNAIIIALPTLREDQAVHWLLNTAAGRSLAQHLSSTTKSEKESVMDRPETLRDIAKQYGMTAVAKHIIGKGGTAVDEHEYTDMWKTEAGSTAAFAKEFAGPRNEKHEAYEIIRNASYVKALGYPDTAGADDSAAAYAKLQKMAGEFRKSQPELSEAQAFSKVFTDPSNVAISNVAHRRPSVG